MKKRTCKRIAAAAMAAMMAITAVPAPNVQAAAKKPTLSVTKKTLTEGQKLTLKVKNKPAKATVTFKSSNKKVATVTKKGVVKAVKKGTATVTVKVKTKGKTYTLKSKITVNRKASQTVSTQSALNSVLKDKKVTKITLKTSAAKKFTVAAGNYTGKTFVVDAANADVVNSGVFKSITIKNIKPDTFTEKAKGNKITVSAKKARVVVDKGAEVSNVAVTTAGSDVLVIVNADAAVDTVAVQAENAKVAVAADGEVSNVEVEKTAEVAVSGTTKDIPVSVAADAAGTKVTAETPVKVTAAAKTEVTLEQGAEGSTVNTTTAAAEVTVANNTTAKVAVTDASGKTTEVAAGKTEEVKPSVTPSTPETPSTPTTPSTPSTPSTPGGSTTPAVTKYTVTFKNGDDVVETVEVEKDTVVTAPADEPTKPGYTFTGWHNGATLYDFDVAVTGDLTLDAKFELANPKAEVMSPTVYSAYDGWTGKPDAISGFGDLTFAEPVVSDDGITYTTSVTGSLNYVTGFTGFNVTLKNEQHGYYVPVMVEIPAATVTTSGAFKIRTYQADGTTEKKTWTGETANGILDTDNAGKRYFSCIFHTAKPNTLKFSIQFSTGNEITYVINLGDVTLNSIASAFGVEDWSAYSAYKIGTRNDTVINADNFCSITEITETVNEAGKHTLALTGTAYYVQNFSAYPENEKEGYYIALHIDGCAGAKISKKKSDDEWNFPAAALGNGDSWSYILYLGKDNVKDDKTFAIEWADGSVVEYTLDLRDMTFDEGGNSGVEETETE